MTGSDFLNILMDQNCIEEWIKKRIILGDICCSLLQNLLPFRLQSIIIKTEMQKKINISVVSYGYKTSREGWVDTLVGKE
jgi:hypothetical protein